MSGPLWVAPDVRRDTLPRIPRQRPRWAAADPLDELTDRLRELTAAAVHPDEIAAVLESDGMTDEHIRLTYGRESSFALAEELYARVPRDFPEPEAAPAAAPWHAGLLACLLRGLVFALPGLAYVLGAPFVADDPVGENGGRGLPAGTTVLLAGALTGWAWNQALAHRAYTWLGFGDRPAAARALLAGAPTGAFLGTAVSVAAAGPGDGGAVVFAAAQALYQGAATALLVLGRERLLLHALVPMAAGALLTPLYDVPPRARAALLVLSSLAVLTLAGRELLRAQPSGGRGPSLLRSVPYGIFGLACGVLILHAVLAEAPAGGTGAGITAPGAVALTLSMGPAEWLLHRFRSGSNAGLRASSTPRAFRRATAVTLTKCLTGYLAALLALTLAATLLWPGAPALDATRGAGLLLIGVMLWSGLLLQAFGAVTAAATVCGAAALAQTLVLFTGGPYHSALSTLVVPGSASVVLAAVVCVRLGRATAHRY
ncbi:hypothetical protein J7I98_02170 [Streptomyces sp. ISL-98]|uniref:hypothetical protein n=1 Tax=Streptomyces sp. ISL-98 TaxID=2819192 RepID=UPI001BE62C1A|nr:hypothetical protein [Streptomyces sp. ISL-98]MBT2504720.1 hypothetical protein [Streptomyces sp. ISL-98]